MIHKNLYYKIYKWENLLLAFLKARRRKTKKDYVKKFEENLIKNLQQLQFELMTQTYKPRPLKTFILRDPKTRKISKSHFRDRIVHHALCNIIEPIFQKSFIYDSCANQKRKGTSFAIKRFDKFRRKATKNLKTEVFCLKADIKHYFHEMNHDIMLNIIKRKISDKRTVGLIKNILNNGANKKGMPLGNLTSQLFANIYLNDLDHFTKHKLKTKFYIRYVDDFIILNKSKQKLAIWKKEIVIFLRINLKLELHPEKSRIISLSKGIDFVGFRNFYYYKLLRKRNIKSMKQKLKLLNNKIITSLEFNKIYQGWKANSKTASTFNLKKEIEDQLTKL